MNVESAESTYNHKCQINLVFTNHSKEDLVNPIIVREIVQAQQHITSLEKLSKHDRYSSQLMDDTEV